MANPVVNLLTKIKKSSRDRHDQKILICIFTYFFSFLEESMDTRLCPHSVLRILLCFISHQVIQLVKQVLNKMIYVTATGLEPISL